MAVVITTPLYVCKTWTVYARHAKRLNHFHMTCLRRLMNIQEKGVLSVAKLLLICVLLHVFKDCFNLV